MKKSLQPYLLILGMLGATPMHAQVIYKISPSSAVNITGTSTISDWVVRSQKISGEMVFIPSGEKGTVVAAGAIKDAKVVLEVSSIKSEKGETMDNKMYSALKRDSYPRITFQLTEPLAVSQVPAKLSARGEVMIGGVTRPMTFDLDLVQDGNSYHLRGTTPLKLSDFEIEPPSAMFGQIETGDDIVVELNLFFGK